MKNYAKLSDKELMFLEENGSFCKIQKQNLGKEKKGAKLNKRTKTYKTRV